MPDSFSAFTSDFYVNMRLQVRMDLPTNRDTVLSLFERIRRDRPEMNRFRRYDNELALEGGGEEGDPSQRWLGVRKTSIRTGDVNPSSLSEGMKLHRLVVDVAPNYLSISPLDVDYVELVYGFDLPASGNHDAIVADALMGSGPLASLMNIRNAVPTSFQPVFGLALTEDGDMQVQFEVKTRPNKAAKGEDAPSSPISVICALRKYGIVSDIKELPNTLRTLSAAGEEMIESRVIPHMLRPIHQVITTNNL
ncbi:MAG TPA: hypothetical protein VEB22_04015 [Phycisphaerales bacterium]|nr:hypothetical protein [Phycisphaerales bacterium]